MNRIALCLLALCAASTAFADKAPAAKQGLHVTFGVGGAWHQVSSSIDGFDDETDIAGGGIGGMLAVGWTLAPGFVLGGGAMGGHIFKPTVTTGTLETESENDLIFLVTGIYADYSLDPAGGLHFQALLGAATLEEGNDDIEDIAIGLGGTLGVGYRWALSDTWSVGALARVQVLSTSSNIERPQDPTNMQVSGTGTADVRNFSVVPAALVGVTWH